MVDGSAWQYAIVIMQSQAARSIFRCGRRHGSTVAMQGELAPDRGTVLSGG